MKDRPRIVFYTLTGIFFSFICIYSGFSPQTRKEKLQQNIPGITQDKTITTVANGLLTLSPNNLIGKVGEVIKFDVILETKENVSAADFFFSFDKNILTLEKINPGIFFPKPKILSQRISNNAGEAIISIGSFTPKFGEGTLITLFFKAKSSGNTTIKIKSETQIVNINGDKLDIELPVNYSYNVIGAAL